MGFFSNLLKGPPKQQDIMVERTDGKVKESVPLSWVKEEEYKKTYEEKKKELVLEKARREAREKAEREVNPPVRPNPFGPRALSQPSAAEQIKHNKYVIQGGVAYPIATKQQKQQSHLTHKMQPPAFLRDVPMSSMISPRGPSMQRKPPRNFQEMMRQQFGGGF